MKCNKNFTVNPKKYSQTFSCTEACRDRSCCSHIIAAGWESGSAENVSNVGEAKPRNEDRNVCLLLVEHWVKPYLKPNTPLIVPFYE